MIYAEQLENLAPAGFFEALGQAASVQALEAIALQARDFWIQLAQEQLTESQLDYINGIQQVELVPGAPLSRVIRLLGDVPLQIENGTPAYDMHDTLLGPKVPVVKKGSGQKGKIAKKGGGFYRAIPFSHQNPGGAGVTATPIGRPYAGHPDVKNVQEMAAAIWNAARKLAPTKGMPGKKITYGGRLPEGMAPKLRPHHATDIYAGMIRSEKKYAKATQSTFTTFRMISTGSPGWIKRAVKGRELALAVSLEVRQRIAPETIEAITRSKA